MNRKQNLWKTFQKGDFKKILESSDVNGTTSTCSRQNQHKEVLVQLLGFKEKK